MMEKRNGWREDCRRLHGHQCDFNWSAWYILRAMGQANSSTVYSSLPNTANDFILSPLDDSDDDEEELFSSTNDQHDEDLFLTSRYLTPCTCTCTQSANILHEHLSWYLQTKLWWGVGHNFGADRSPLPGGRPRHGRRRPRPRRCPALAGVPWGSRALHPGPSPPWSQSKSVVLFASLCAVNIRRAIGR